MDEFVRKFKLQYSEIIYEEIANFIRIYLQYEPAENNCEKSDIYFDDWILISRICFIIPYLAQEGDYNYIWMIEYNSSGIHFP